MAYENYEQVTGVITAISTGDSCCSQMVSVRNDEGITNFIISMDTKIVDNVRLRRGMRIAAFYDMTLPTPRIYPPQYQAELVTVLRSGQSVMLNYFDDDLVSSDNALRLNIGPMTNIVTANGQRFTCSPQNMELLVYYTTTTLSIPAMTTPQKIIVMCNME